MAFEQKLEQNNRVVKHSSSCVLRKKNLCVCGSVCGSVRRGREVYFFRLFMRKKIYDFFIFSSSENATKTRIVIADLHVHLLGSFANIKVKKKRKSLKSVVSFFFFFAR